MQTFKLCVVGTLWSGAESAYEYTVESIPETNEQATRLADDFQSVSDFRIVSIKSGGHWSRSWTERQVLREWQDAMSEELFAAGE